MIDWGRFGILTAVRGAIAAAIAAIFCAIFPGSIPLVLGICGGGLGVSSLITLGSAIFCPNYGDIERGDLEFYDIPEMGILGRAEDATIDLIEDACWRAADGVTNIKDKIKEKHQENKAKKAEKKASRLFAKMLTEEAKKIETEAKEIKPSGKPKSITKVHSEQSLESETSTSDEVSID